MKLKIQNRLKCERAEITYRPGQPTKRVRCPWMDTNISVKTRKLTPPKNCVATRIDLPTEEEVRKAIRDAEAALTADPSPIIDVVQATFELANQCEAGELACENCPEEGICRTVAALRKQQPGVWNK